MRSRKVWLAVGALSLLLVVGGALATVQVRRVQDHRDEARDRVYGYSQKLTMLGAWPVYYDAVDIVVCLREQANGEMRGIEYEPGKDETIEAFCNRRIGEYAERVWANREELRRQVASGELALGVADELIAELADNKLTTWWNEVNRELEARNARLARTRFQVSFGGLAAAFPLADAWEANFARAGDRQWVTCRSRRGDGVGAPGALVIRAVDEEGLAGEEAAAKYRMYTLIPQTMTFRVTVEESPGKTTWDTFEPITVSLTDEEYVEFRAAYEQVKTTYRSVDKLHETYLWKLSERLKTALAERPAFEVKLAAPE